MEKIESNFTELAKKANEMYVLSWKYIVFGDKQPQIGLWLSFFVWINWIWFIRLFNFKIKRILGMHKKWGPRSSSYDVHYSLNQ